MFSQTQFQTLFAYHWHTTDRLLNCAAKLNTADYQDNPGHGHGSIHNLLLHLLSTNNGWRRGLETGQQQLPPAAETYPDLASLQQGFQAEQTAWEAFLAGLTASDIEGAITLTTLRGTEMVFPRWRVLQHLILHGMQHHSELAQLLTAKGQSPGDIDFIFFRG